MVDFVRKCKDKCNKRDLSKTTLARANGGRREPTTVWLKAEWPLLAGNP